MCYGEQKMSNGEESFNKAMDLFNNGKYYDAMTNFTKSYNESGNTRALFYSAEATFQFAKNYLKDNAIKGWKSFSESARSKFDVCLRYTTSPEIKQKATERIRQIDEFNRKVDELVGSQ